MMVGMDFANERYVRVFTRDTMRWLMLSMEAQGLYCLMIRKADRSGVIEFGGAGKRAVAVVVGHPTRASDVESMLDELAASGLIRLADDSLCFVDFIDSQEAVQSDRQRQKESRERRGVRSQASRNVTDCHASTGRVTKCHSSLASQTSQPDQPIDIPPSAGVSTGDAKGKGADPRHGPFMAAWAEAHQTHRMEPAILGAADGASVKRLLKSIPKATIEDIRARISIAFADSWFRVHGSLPILCSKWTSFNPLFSSTYVSPVSNKVIIDFHPETREPIYGERK